MKIAAIENYEAVLKMVISFSESSPYSKNIDFNKLEDLVLGILTNHHPRTVIIIDEENRGFISGCYNTHPFLKGTIATELAWWVNEEHRNNGVGEQLLSEFEHWAKEQGCSYISMVCLNDTVSEIYENKGYTLQEKAYWKVLN